MNTVRLCNRGSLLLDRLEVCVSGVERMRGLLGRRAMPPGAGMLLAPCLSIHTFFMKFPIDVLVLNRELCVLEVKRRLVPWRVFFGGFRAWGMVEVQSGWMPIDAVNPGDVLEVRD